AGELQRLTALINARPDRPVVIAGHSSGGALSNALAGKVRVPPKNVRLVSLDGFAPSAELQSKFQVTCWSARSTISGLSSQNRQSMISRCGRNHREVVATDPNCTSSWCLHFTVFNLGANSNSNWNGGYGNMKPNMAWISEELPDAATPPSPGHFI